MLMLSRISERVNQRITSALNILPDHGSAVELFGEAAGSTVAWTTSSEARNDSETSQEFLRNATPARVFHSFGGDGNSVVGVGDGGVVSGGGVVIAGGGGTMTVGMAAAAAEFGDIGGFNNSSFSSSYITVTTSDPSAMISDVGALDDYGMFMFITYGVLVTVIGIMGLAGNALSIVVLSRPQMKSSINCCLIGLASFDSLVLVTSMLIFGLRNLCLYTRTFLAYNSVVFPYITPYVYPLGMIAQTGSVWVTVTVTVERYVAVCLPLRAKSLCTYGRARVYIAVITASSIIYNLPRFWEVDLRTIVDPGTNATLGVGVEPSWLRKNQSYINVYITWMYLFVLYFVPFVILAVLNGIIWIRVRRANRERQKLSRLQQKEMGLAVMLFCVVVVFFICNLLALVANILEMVDVIIDQLTASSNLLVTMNSSVNFVIYCIFGQKFRRILLRTVCSCCPTSLRRDTLSRSGADLEDSVYPVSSANTAETKPLMHYNGNGVGLSTAANSLVATSVLGTASSNNNGSSCLHSTPVRSGSVGTLHHVAAYSSSGETAPLSNDSRLRINFTRCRKPKFAHSLCRK